MPLSWNAIKARAAAFVNDWRDKAPGAREEADAQTFENEFFNIFGVKRSQVALFEKKVKLQDNKGHGYLSGDTPGGPSGYIDLFWEGHILIEMKSPGKDMTKAYDQARHYALALPKEADLPRGILICDFVTFHYYNLQEEGKLYRFNLDELASHIELFGDLAGYKEIDPYKHWDPVNIEAAEEMGKLHDRLKEIGYQGRQLELYLVRLLFCLFADDTGIFDAPNIFNKYIIQRTKEDGSDLALHVQKIFETLKKPIDGGNYLFTEKERDELLAYLVVFIILPIIWPVVFYLISKQFLIWTKFRFLNTVQKNGKITWNILMLQMKY